MEILRIPTRYKKQLSRISKDKRLWVFDSLLTLCGGENVTLPDDPGGDILELIWRDSIQMENRNTKVSDMKVGILEQLCGSVEGYTTSPCHPEPERKGNEVKGKEILTLLEFWNSLTVPPAKFKNKNYKVGDKIMMKCNGNTQLLTDAYKKAINIYTEEQIIQAVKTYANDILKREPDQGFATHQFSIKQFLTQKNAIHEFVLR